jgi:LPXTG-site transpeptidase (sortase) family protein
VINSANVEWSSIQIDPAPRLVPQSTYNIHSTERRYDPLSQAINDYYASSSATLSVPVHALPQTGFAPNVKTVLSQQPNEKMYAATALVLEIPSLNVRLPIVGIPKKDGAWDVTWLGNQAGWLAGTAFPSWNGNSVLTGHVYDSNGLPGPFVNLNKLKYGDTIIIHVSGQKYIFEVRSNQVVSPDDSSGLKHEERSWLTLITCKEYDQKTDSYKKRVVVRAVLVKVERDGS